MYDEAQEKFKGMKEEERFFFKIVKSKKRKGGKNEDITTIPTMVAQAPRRTFRLALPIHSLQVRRRRVQERIWVV